ncbi:hypothetical protein [Streptomyces sp. NPDC058751]|uniref:hypothetical protein n=1 Tax=Streptomyces sp. NPDC058751 TaxID=3346623 RepID=UPI0036B152B4
MPTPTETSQGDRPPHSADVERARLWLAGRGMSDVRPTALLGKRLAVRQSSRLFSSLLLAAFILALALIYTLNRPADGASTSADPYPYGPLLLVTAVVAALVVAQALLDRRVRHVDRQAGEALQRRAAHTVHLGWRTVLGPPRAALAAGTFAAASALTAVALTVRTPGVRYPATVLLIGLCGVATVMAVQLRHVLTRPAVAEDEDSLTADALMRVEDAREVAVPTMVWCMPWYLPAASMADIGLGWWNAAWIALIAVGAVTLVLITWRTGRSGTVAPHITTGR